MLEYKTENQDADFSELDDVLDHAFFSDDKNLIDDEDEALFTKGANDFRTLDEL